MLSGADVSTPRSLNIDEVSSIPKQKSLPESLLYSSVIFAHFSGSNLRSFHSYPMTCEIVMQARSWTGILSGCSPFTTASSLSTLLRGFIFPPVNRIVFVVFIIYR